MCNKRSFTHAAISTEACLMNKSSRNITHSLSVFPSYNPLSEEADMRFTPLIALPLLMVTASPVLAKGCIRGAAAGGVGGHFVGKGHAVMGAAAGCVIAHHHYAKKARAQKAAARTHG
jgi:outer membrane lipoprotein SlyB